MIHILVQYTDFVACMLESRFDINMLVCWACAFAFNPFKSALEAKPQTNNDKSTDTHIYKQPSHIATIPYKYVYIFRRKRANAIIGATSKKTHMKEICVQQAHLSSFYLCIEIIAFL